MVQDEYFCKNISVRNKNYKKLEKSNFFYFLEKFHPQAPDGRGSGQDCVGHAAQDDPGSSLGDQGEAFGHGNASAVKGDLY